MHDEQQVGVTVVDTQAQPRTISAKTGEKAHIHMNTNVQNILAAEQAGTPRPAGGDVFQQEWLDACKGKYNGVTHGTSSKTHCDFDYSGTMIEQMLLGLVAHRVGKKITYDPATGRVTNAPEANDYLKRTYRSGWTLNG